MRSSRSPHSVGLPGPQPASARSSERSLAGSFFDLPRLKLPISFRDREPTMSFESMQRTFHSTERHRMHDHVQLYFAEGLPTTARRLLEQCE